MDAFLASILVVAVGEIGDKTQLLALVLAVRFRRPLPIVLGILVATLANHALAGALGAWVRSVVPMGYLRWLLAASFLAVALWALKPDRHSGEDSVPPGRTGVFTATAIAFFLAEIGDRRIATVMRCGAVRQSDRWSLNDAGHAHRGHSGGLSPGARAPDHQGRARPRPCSSSWPSCAGGNFPT
jgi:putative Ca2+/H+ antiporter (TMEM165/GDT1 family)